MRRLLGQTARLVMASLLVACASAPPRPPGSAQLPSPPLPAARPGGSPAPPVGEPALAGAWQGELLVSSLRLVLRIESRGAGWTVNMDSPDQGAHDIPAGSVRVRGDSLEIAIPQIGGRYQAKLKEGTLAGTWTQNGHASPLDFARQPGGPSDAGMAGKWQGTLPVHLTFVLHVAHTVAGWTATADSPDQHAAGIPVASVTVAGNAVVFAMPRIDASFTAHLDRDRLVGVFTQQNRALPLELTRTAHPPSTVARAQEPRRPLPYEELAVAIPGGAKDVTLACTLTKPPGNGPFAGVVLATGSGPQNRDETLMGHKPFLVLSDAVTRAGLEVLRCDDRGVGSSTGTFATATTLDFAQDALASVAWLGTRPEISRNRIGIVGHSEGAAVAAIAAASSPDVAFIVMLAGAALPGRDVEHLQRAWVARRAGASKREIAEARVKWDQAYDIIGAEPDPAVAKSRLRALYDGLPAAEREALERAGGFEAIASQLLAPWHRAFLILDPGTYLTRVRVPVLALYGERDMQVEPAAHLPEVRKALAHDADVTIRELPGLNHLFQTATTGAPSEYGEIAETMSPAALSVITDWLARHAR